MILFLKFYMIFIMLVGEAAKEIEKSRINVGDFQMLQVIGRGAFGEVQLVKLFIEIKLVRIFFFFIQKIMGITNNILLVSYFTLLFYSNS